MYAKSMILVILLASMMVLVANADLAAEDKSIIEKQMVRDLTNYSEIVYASAQVDNSDYLRVRIVHSKGDTPQQTFDNIIHVIEYATCSYVDAVHRYMSLNRMDLACDVNTTKVSLTAYCFPDWARKVRYGADNKANETDLMICSLKAIGTLEARGEWGG